MNRRHVRAPRIYGWGQLVVTIALSWQLGVGLVISHSDARPPGTLIGAAILLAGLIVMMLVSSPVAAGRAAAHRKPCPSGHVRSLTAVRPLSSVTTRHSGRQQSSELRCSWKSAPRSDLVSGPAQQPGADDGGL